MDSQEDFWNKFANAAIKIGKKNTLEVLERLCEIYITAEINQSSYVTFITNIAQLLGDDFGATLSFLQQPASLQIPRLPNVERQVQARLEKLRLIYGPILIATQQALSRPMGFKAFAASGDQNRASFYLNFIRHDQQVFSMEVFMNDLLQIYIQIADNMVNRTSKPFAGC